MASSVSVLKGTDNSFETTSEMFNGPATDFVSEGVVGAVTNTSGVAPMTGAFAANEQGTPDMTVAVTSGVAYVQATPASQASQMLRVYFNANENVTIAANSSGSTKYDWIYIKIDATNADAPDASASNVASLVVSRSTSASTDDGTPPTYGYPIAVVTVANGASSITDANISDSRAQTGANPADGDVTTVRLADDSVTGAKMGLDTTSWTPTITPGGSMTYGSVTKAANYIDLGEVFWVDFRSTGTVGGALSNTFTISNLPFSAASDTETTLACFVADNGANEGGFAYVSGADAITVKIRDNTAWATGTGVLRFSGIIRKA